MTKAATRARVPTKSGSSTSHDSTQIEHTRTAVVDQPTQVRRWHWRASREPATPEISVKDRRFAEQLAAIGSLKQLFFDEKIQIKAEYLREIDLGSLNNLRYRSAGRLPTEDEWRALDQKLAALTSLLTPELRWKAQVRDWTFFFRTLPVVSILVSAITMFLIPVLSVLIADHSSMAYIILYMINRIIWTIAQGVLGACAFLNISVMMHASKTRSASHSPYSAFDVTDKTILTTRVILGALFALLLGLPIAGPALTVLRESFVQSNTLPPIKDYIIVVAPFSFGFSTTLVLSIFERIVKGVSALFGVSLERGRGE